MLENKQLAVIIARHVFPSMRSFRTDWVSKIGTLEARLSEDSTAARVFVRSDEAPHYLIKTSDGRVEVAHYMDGVWETESFLVNDLTGVPAVARKIRKFFGAC